MSNENIIIENAVRESLERKPQLDGRTSSQLHGVTRLIIPSCRTRSWVRR